MKHCDWHNICIRVSTGYADSITTDCSCNTGTVSAVSVIVAHTGGVIHEIPPMNIINEAVAIIVAVISTIGFMAVCPYIVGKIRVCNINAGVKDSDYRTFGSDGRHTPKFIKSYG